VRSAIGFGDALLAMPVLAIFIGLNIATPIVALCSVTYSILILSKEWRRVKIKDVLVLVITAFLGIPIGIYLLKGNYESLLKIFLGVTVILFSLFNLIKNKSFYLKSDKSSFVFGFLSGILGGAYNTNGPPVLIYSALRGWDPKTFRATLQGYFLPTGFMIAIGHFLGGLWSKEILLNYVFLLPVILAGVLIGGFVNKKINEDDFNVYISGFLIIIGIVLILKNV